MKNIGIILLMGILWFSFVPAITAEVKDVTIVLGTSNSDLKFLTRNTAQDAVPELINNEVFLPLRLVAEQLSIPIHWDSVSRQVLTEFNGTTSRLDFSNETVVVVIDEAIVEFEQPPYLQLAQVMVPASFVVDAWHLNVV